MAPVVLVSPAVLNRVRHNLTASVDPSLTTPELPVFRTRSKIDFARVERPLRKRSWHAFAGLAMGGLLLTAAAYFQPWKALPAESASVAIHANDTPRSVTVDRPTTAATGQRRFAGHDSPLADNDAVRTGQWIFENLAQRPRNASEGR